MATKPGSPSLQGGNALSSGLVVGLMLGEGSGTTSTDLTGNGHDATLSGGATWTTDVAGNAVACTGGGYLSVPWPAVGTNDDFTILIIHKPTTYPSGFTTLFGDASQGWLVDLSTGGSASFNGPMTNIGGHEGMTTGSLWQYLYTRDRSGGGGGTVYVNGTQTDTGNGGISVAGAVTMKFGLLEGGGANYDGLYDAVYLWNRVLSGADITSLTADPYQMFRPAGGGTITGSLSVTLGALTASSAGTVLDTGAVGQTLGALTSAATGTVLVTGALSVTLSAVTISASGQVVVAGTSSVTLGTLTVSAAGTVTITGTAANTLGALTSAGSGTVLVTGSLAVTLGALTLSAGNHGALPDVGARVRGLYEPVLSVPGLYAAAVRAQGLYESTLSVGGNPAMPTRTDVNWKRGDHKTFRVVVGGSDDMTSWTATLVWRRPGGAVVLTVSGGTVDPTGRTADFDVVSALTASLTDAQLEWTAWRTDGTAANAELGYGTVTLYGGPIN